MKPYTELTYLGRLRRMRTLARAALEAYGLSADRSCLNLILQAGNTLYRVTDAAQALGRPGNGLFEADRFLLRVHQPGYQTPEALELELAWLRAMRLDADLPVPEPVAATDGRLLVSVSIPGIPGERRCSLLRWVKGRNLTSGIGVYHYRAQGRLMARLHDHAAQWRPPAGLTKRRWDCDGWFKDVEGADMSASDIWPLMEPRYVDQCQEVVGRVERLLAEWGTGPERYGLIHADLATDANLLFWRGEPRAIDFDDSGFGYWIYDLAVALEHCREDRGFPRFRDALLEGYSAVRTLPDDPVQHLGLFLAAWDVYLSLWATVGAHFYPRYREEALQRRERAAGFVARYLEGG